MSKEKKSVAPSAIMSATFDDLPEPWDLPSGVYMLELRRYNAKQVGEDEDKRDIVEMMWSPVGYVSSDSDLVDEDTDFADAYPVKDTFWLHTKGSRSFVRDWFRKNGFDTKGVTIGDLFQSAIGLVVKAEVELVVSENGRSTTKVVSYLRND